MSDDDRVGYKRAAGPARAFRPGVSGNPHRPAETQPNLSQTSCSTQLAAPAAVAGDRSPGDQQPPGPRDDVGRGRYRR